MDQFEISSRGASFSDIFEVESTPYDCLEFFCKISEKSTDIVC